MATEKTITLRLDDEIHRKIKVQAALKGLTLKQYIIDLASADIKQTEIEQGKKQP